MTSLSTSEIDVISIEAANLYRAIDELSYRMEATEKISDHQRSHDAFLICLEELVNLHREFYARAALILLGEDDIDAHDRKYHEAIQKESEYLQTMVESIRNGGPSWIRRGSVGEKFARKVEIIFDDITKEWLITPENRLIFLPED